MKPADAQYTAYGQHYKTGRHGFLFRWNGDEWIRTSTSPSEVRNINRAGAWMRDRLDRIRKGNGRKPLPLKDGKKECRSAHGCGEWKPLSEFARHSNGYYYSHCKACERNRQAAIRRAA